MSWLPWVLLCFTVTIKYLIARHNRLGFWIDLTTIPLWSFWYYHVGAYPLLIIPWMFGAFDLKAIFHWWQPSAA